MYKNTLEHVAFILDGNKRWAKNNNIGLKKAYREGLKNITSVINQSIKKKINYLTLFTLSSENIKRASVSSIFQVIYDDFSFFFDEIIKEKNVRIKIFGTKKNLPNKILKLIEHCEKETELNNKLYLNLAFNYGFKDEIRQVLLDVQSNKEINLNDEKQINNLFLLGSFPDPDLLIRTGGQKRLSNFIMFNLTYTEIFFIETLWPDFNQKEFDTIIDNYTAITRSYGL